MKTIEISIESNDKVMPQTYDLLSVQVVNEVNRISYAELVLIDGNYANQKYDISDNKFFDPGKPISISVKEMHVGAPVKVIFKGYVVAQTLKYDEGNSLLTVEITDKATTLTTTKWTNVFENIKDSQFISNTILRTGLQAGTVTDTGFTHERLVQYNCTDWDMLLSRADASGLLVTAVNGKVSAIKPEIDMFPKVTFNLAVNDIYDLELKLDVREQYKFSETNTWDEREQAPAVLRGKAFKLNQGAIALTDSRAGETFGNDGERLMAQVPLSDGEAKAWSTGRSMRTKLAMLRGSFKVDGVVSLDLLDTIGLTGMGKKFEGDTLLTGIRQEITRDGWFTHLQFGLSPEAFSKNAQINDVPAGGLLPGINGLQVGIVLDIEADATNQARVKVRMPGTQQETKVLWARMANLDAGKARGTFFWPEKGDEVILGFINDDPRFAVILGSLYGSKNTPPLPRDDKNAKKGFISRSGIKMLFDDEEQKFTLLTSENHRIVIDQKKRFIELNDNTGNNIKLSEDGISINAYKDLHITSKGTVGIKGDKIMIQGNSIDFK